MARLVPVWSDDRRNLWLIRNPDHQDETVEIKPFSVPLVGEGRWMVRWEDVCPA